MTDFISSGKIKLYDREYDGYLQVDGLQCDDGLLFTANHEMAQLSFSQVVELRDWLDRHIYDVKQAKVDA